MVVVLVVDGQLPQALAGELAAAAGTHVREELQRALAVTGLALLPVAPGLNDNPFGVEGLFFSHAVGPPKLPLHPYLSVTNHNSPGAQRQPAGEVGRRRRRLFSAVRWWYNARHAPMGIRSLPC